MGFLQKAPVYPCLFPKCSVSYKAGSEQIPI